MSVITKVGDAYAAMRARFHGGQVAGQFYKEPPEYHSLGGRGGRRDSNGNLLGPDGRVIGRNAALFGTTSHSSWVRTCGAFERLYR
jgi:hypothetical protein